MIPVQSKSKALIEVPTTAIVKRKNTLQEVKSELTKAGKDLSRTMKKMGKTAKTTARRTKKRFNQGYSSAPDGSKSSRLGRFGARLYKKGRSDIRNYRAKRSKK